MTGRERQTKSDRTEAGRWSETGSRQDCVIQIGGKRTYDDNAAMLARQEREHKSLVCMETERGNTGVVQ